MERMTDAGNDSLAAHPKARFVHHIDQTVWELRRGTHAFTRRFGFCGWIVLVLGFVGALAWSVERQQRVEMSALHVRLAEQSSKQTLSSLAMQGQRPDAHARLNDFENYLLPHEDIPFLVQDLLRLAEDEGLSIQRGEYRPQIDAEGGFLRYRMSLPIKGAASAIHRFMQAALRTQKNLALESVHFKRERIESTDIEARIEWVVLVRLPSRGVNSTMPRQADIRGS